MVLDELETKSVVINTKVYTDVSRRWSVKKELTIVKRRIKKLLEKKALIDEELEPLFIREEELENEEIIAICRKNNITINDLMAKVNREKAEMKKENKNEKFEE